MKKQISFRWLQDNCEYCGCSDGRKICLYAKGRCREKICHRWRQMKDVAKEDKDVKEQDDILNSKASLTPLRKGWSVYVDDEDIFNFLVTKATTIKDERGRSMNFFGRVYLKKEIYHESQSAIEESEQEALRLMNICIGSAIVEERRREWQK